MDESLIFRYLKRHGWRDFDLFTLYLGITAHLFFTVASCNLRSTKEIQVGTNRVTFVVMKLKIWFLVRNLVSRCWKLLFLVCLFISKGDLIQNTGSRELEIKTMVVPWWKSVYLKEG